MEQEKNSFSGDPKQSFLNLLSKAMEKQTSLIARFLEEAMLEKRRIKLVRLADGDNLYQVEAVETDHEGVIFKDTATGEAVYVRLKYIVSMGDL